MHRPRRQPVAERAGGDPVTGQRVPRRHPLDFLAEHPELVALGALLVAVVVWLVIR